MVSPLSLLVLVCLTILGKLFSVLLGVLTSSSLQTITQSTGAHNPLGPGEDSSESTSPPGWLGDRGENCSTDEDEKTTGSQLVASLVELLRLLGLLRKVDGSHVSEGTVVIGGIDTGVLSCWMMTVVRVVRQEGATPDEGELQLGELV